MRSLVVSSYYIVHFTATAPANGAVLVFDTEIENTVFQFYVDVFKYLHRSMSSSSAFLERVLQDEVIAQNDDMEQDKAAFQEYILEVHERSKPLPKNITALDGFLHIVASIHTFNVFEDILQRYNTTALNAPTNEVVLIEAALKRNGLDALISDLRTKKMEFINKFLRNMSICVANLSEEDRVKDWKVVEWYQSYSKKSDDERANDVFTLFSSRFGRF
ncbi:uncharacterized protein LOC129247344 [Anastrepha obliqua]|uniref:uncharacterized protein LOC129247344 n=1 Tax=Anastrepha obliqua TaxID=95512 RepID=UPI002409892F|nr:uncharacterized protein LOC129247344 [Anastrepha obliqua]